MNPEDRVVVGVINRIKDLNLALHEHWYRIPQKRVPNGVEAEIIAFFLSGSTFKAMSGGIHYYASIHGIELQYRKDLIPGEANHPRANEVYYRMSLGPLTRKIPPIINHQRRSIAFIYTTADRFFSARTIGDLYSEDAQFVDRE